MKILAIGNSFSQDELTYLHQIAKSANKDVLAVNLYIGGCTLEQHSFNLATNARAYELQINGYATGELVSIDDALTMYDWDIIYTHQASALSGFEATYYPHITILLEYISRVCPGAKLYLDETWTYEERSDNPGFRLYNNDCEEMQHRVSQTYRKIANSTGLPMIPCGEVLWQAVKRGVGELYRDGFHMHLIYGRYLMGCVLYERLIGSNVLDASFIPYLSECANADLNKLACIRELVHEYMVNYL